VRGVEVQGRARGEGGEIVIGQLMQWAAREPAEATAITAALVVLLAFPIEWGLGWVQRRLHCSCRRRVR
jgi:hypothetical protein